MTLAVALGSMAIGGTAAAVGPVPDAAVAPTMPDALASLPLCRPWPPGRVTTPGGGGVRWEGRLDEQGRLLGYRLTVDDEAYETGPRAFAEGPFDGILVVGERGTDSTRMTLLDMLRRCAVRRLTVGTLVYGTHLQRAEGALYFSAVEPATRRELGIWRLGQEPGAHPARVIGPPADAVATAVPRSVRIRWDAGPVGEWCGNDRCVEGRAVGGSPADGPEADETEASLPIVSARPVPTEPAPRWPLGADLAFRWPSTETPPSWIRPALLAAAEDVARTARSRVPSFRLDPAAVDTVRYVTVMPAGACWDGIACASYAVNSSFTIRIRAHGYDFRWGTLRWCQADDRDGCFDVERIGVHEFGHVIGLDHPENAGFRLKPFDSIMNHIAPAKPAASWQVHHFLPCDVATLQERYGVPSPSTRISACNEVATKLELIVPTSTTVPGQAVVFTAQLRVADRDTYGRLAANKLAGRSVQLRRRLASLSGGWTTFWMRDGANPGSYTLELMPGASYDYQAVFSTPTDEGLTGSTSSIVTVRVTEACDGLSCQGTGGSMQ